MPIRFWYVLLPLVLSGCGEKSSQPTQVAAKVNGEEITIHQVNHLLQLNRISEDATPAAKRAVLDRLIDQKLAVQQAIEQKLDRTPKVVQQLDASRNEVLANAYMERVTSELPKREDWEGESNRQIAEFYDAHPGLFAQRRFYTLDELNFVAPNEVATDLRAFLQGNPTLQAIAEWLANAGINVEATRSSRWSEQIAIALLPRMLAMHLGDIQLVELGGNRFQVIRMVSFQEAPVDRTAAAPRIQQYLANQDSTQLVTIKIKDLRQVAKIEYMGEFSKETLLKK